MLENTRLCDFFKWAVQYGNYNAKDAVRNYLIYKYSGGQGPHACNLDSIDAEIKDILSEKH